MTHIRAFLSKLLGAWTSRRRDEALSEEIQAHLDLLASEHMRKGVSADAARVAARRAFGGIEQLREACRQQRGFPWLDDARQDVKFAARSLRKNPTFSLVVIGTLAVGIGANAALFAVARGVLFSALEVTAPDELVQVSCVNPSTPGDECGASYPGFLMFAENRTVLSGLFAFYFLPELHGTWGGRAERLSGLLLSGSAFEVLGLSAERGRTLDRRDEQAGAPLVAMLSHSYWVRRFGADPAAIGRTLFINRQPVTIVGVTPSSFRGTVLGDTPDVLLPMAMADAFAGRGRLTARANFWLRMMGRRRSGVSVDEVRRALEPTFERTMRDFVAALPPEAAAGLQPVLKGFRFRVVSAATGAESRFRRTLEVPIRILWSGVGLVLVIVCANLTGLFVARTMNRRGELAVRLALGSTRGRLARQVLTEGLFLSAVGGLAGLVVARLLAPALISLAAGRNALLAIDLQLDPMMIAFTGAVTIGAGLVIALASVARAVAAPQIGVRQVRAPRTQTHFARALVAAQVALTVVLLVAAGLFTRTLSNFRNLDPGFARDQLLTATVAPGLAGYAPERSAAYLQQAVAAIKELPGILSVTYADLPTATGRIRQTGVGVGATAPTAYPEAVAGFTRVGPEFVETLGLTLARGRAIAETDVRAGAAVAVVNESFAKRFFAGTDPIGTTFRLAGGQTRPTTIIGVVHDGRDRSIKNPSEPWAYIALSGAAPPVAWLTVRANGGVPSLVPGVTRILERVDSGVPVYDAQAMEEQIDQTLRAERLLANVSAGFAGTALFLVALGLYGVLKGAVTQRTGELAVRMALGAKSGQIVRLMVYDTVAIIGPGIAVGLAGAFLASRVIQNRLFEVEPTDPSTVGLAVTILLLTVLAAVWLPTRSASRLDPMVALRHE